jgi:ferritin-like metal-binding protein YciE
MIIENPLQLFEHLLSELRTNAENITPVLLELSRGIEDPDINEALEVYVFVSNAILDRLDQCFKLIGGQPVKFQGRLQDLFIEECRAELANIQSQTAKRLYVLANLNQLIHLRVGKYAGVIECGEMTGHCGIRLLLETCHADDVSFIELTKRLIRNIVEGNGVASAVAHMQGAKPN